MLDYSIYAIIISISIVLIPIITLLVRSLFNNPLLARRSVVKYKDQKVSNDIIIKAVKMAILAPNHFLSEPWRFYLCSDRVKNEIIKLNESKRELFKSVPYWMIVTMKSEHAMYEKLYFEDHSACSCAVQNFMLSLASDGIGSKWVTGALGIKEVDILRTIDCGIAEKFIGIIWFGYPQENLLSMPIPERKLGIKMFSILN